MGGGLTTDRVSAYGKSRCKSSPTPRGLVSTSTTIHQVRRSGNKDGTRMFLHIHARNWRARPLEHRLAVSRTDAATTTKTGLESRKRASTTANYENGHQVSDDEMKALRHPGRRIPILNGKLHHRPRLTSNQSSMPGLVGGDINMVPECPSWQPRRFNNRR